MTKLMPNYGSQKAFMSSVLVDRWPLSGQREFLCSERAGRFAVVVDVIKRQLHRATVVPAVVFIS